MKNEVTFRKIDPTFIGKGMALGTIVTIIAGLIISVILNSYSFWIWAIPMGSTLGITVAIILGWHKTGDAPESKAD